MTLEDRLQAWGAAEAQAAGTHPDLALERPRRRRLPRAAGVTLSAAAAVIVVAAGVMVVNNHQAGPTLAASPTGVPWADLPARAIAPDPATTADPSVRSCRAGDLSAGNAGGNGGGGSNLINIGLTNVSDTACRLPVGLDSISAVHLGQRSTLPVHRGSDPVSQPSSPPGTYSGQVLLRPGQSGSLTLSYYARCDVARNTIDARYSQLRLRLAGGEVVLPHPEFSLDLGCANPETAISAGFYGPDPVDPAPAAADVTLTLPTSVRAGSVLHYTVTLRPTNGALTFGRCPNFVQVLRAAQQKQRHALNCAAAQPIPVGGSETFNMELFVPADTAAGPAQLTWSSSDGVVGDAAGTVTVTP